VENERLFDVGTRSDSRPGRHGETSFHVLNRRAGALWDRVRSHLESCYAAFPDEHKPGLVGRLRDDDERQHLPAWWELYVFTLFDRLKYKIEVHPELPGATDKKDRPDFLVTKGPVSMYVEAAVVFNDDLKSDAWNWVCDCVNEAKNPDFKMVDLEIPTQGKRRPPKKEIIGPLEEWLATWDAHQVVADYNAGSPLPRTQLRARDWVLDYTAAPVSPDRPGVPGRLIASYPIQAVDFRRDVKQLRKTLKHKGSKYGMLRKPLDKPLVMAITSWNFLDESEVKETLFAPRGGYWRVGAEPRGTRISGLLFAEIMRVRSVASRLPELWINPRPLNAMPPLPPFGTVALDDGELVRADASMTAGDLFDLSPEWPDRD
jgi:hypothetical protein